MGEIADMMLEGILDEETGEYIGDRNKSRYGTEAPGFPVSYEREEREGEEAFNEEDSFYEAFTERVPPEDLRPRMKLPCPICGKKCWASGLSDHILAKHNIR